MIDDSEVLQQAQDFLRRMISLLDLDVTCELDCQSDVVNVSLSGDDASLLLNHNAQLLYAINHLLNQVFARRQERIEGFLVDCNDFRNTRSLELKLLAEKAAEKVSRSKEPYPLHPMPANERRIIHLALANEEAVRTESAGTGERRHVVILPSAPGD